MHYMADVSSLPYFSTYPPINTGCPPHDIKVYCTLEYALHDMFIPVVQYFLIYRIP